MPIMKKARVLLAGSALAFGGAAATLGTMMADAPQAGASSYTSPFSPIAHTPSIQQIDQQRQADAQRQRENNRPHAEAQDPHAAQRARGQEQLRQFFGGPGPGDPHAEGGSGTGNETGWNAPRGEAIP